MGSQVGPCMASDIMLLTPSLRRTAWSRGEQRRQTDAEWRSSAKKVHSEVGSWLAALHHWMLD
jgi:hypothetical protein